MPTPLYKRVLLKLSGEALAGESGQGISPKAISQFASDLADAHATGVEIGLVIGAGNIFRGVSDSAKEMNRSSADYMGMLAICINSLALQDALEKKNLETRVQSAITMAEVAEPYIRRKAIRHIEKKRIVIFAAGTGNPYFTSDTAAALRAMEINADIILKATKVDGIFDRDPLKYPNTKLFKKLKYIDVLNKGLTIMDSTAISLCMDNKLPIRIFNLTKKGNILKVLCDDEIGTTVN